MKQLIVIVLALLWSCISYAQYSQSILIHVGKGVITQEDSKDYTTIGYTTTLSIDKKKHKCFSIGGYIAYNRIRLKQHLPEYNSIISGTEISTGLRVNIHYYDTKRLGLYTGGMIGCSFLSLKDFIPKDPSILITNELKAMSIKPISSMYLGIRYSPKKWLGYFLEAGRGKEILTMGISLKIG